MHTLSSAEAAGLSEAQTKMLLLMLLRGCLRDVAGVMLARGLPLKYAAKLLLSLAVRQTRMREILASYERAHLSSSAAAAPSPEEAMREIKEVVLLITSDAVVREVSPEAGEAMRTDLFLLKLAKVLPEAYLDSFRDRGMALDEIMREMGERGDQLESAFRLAASAATDSAAGTVKKKRDAEIKATEGAAKVGEGKGGAGQGPVSELVDLEIGTAIEKEGGIDKREEPAPEILRAEDRKGLLVEDRFKSQPRRQRTSQEGKESLDRLLEEASLAGSLGDDSSSYASDTDEEELESSSSYSAGEEGLTSLPPHAKGGKSRSRVVVTAKTSADENPEFVDPHEYEDVSEGMEVEKEEEEEYYHDQGAASSSSSTSSMTLGGQVTPAMQGGQVQMSSQKMEEEEEEDDYDPPPPVTERISESSEESKRYDELYDKMVDEGKM